jgi:hypothetical protein
VRVYAYEYVYASEYVFVFFYCFFSFLLLPCLLLSSLLFSAFCFSSLLFPCLLFYSLLFFCFLVFSSLLSPSYLFPFTCTRTWLHTCICTCMRLCGHVCLCICEPNNMFQVKLLLANIFCRSTKADSTLRSSQVVPHPSTNRALSRLTSEVERDPVHST